MVHGKIYGALQYQGQHGIKLLHRLTLDCIADQEIVSTAKEEYTKVDEACKALIAAKQDMNASLAAFLGDDIPSTIIVKSESGTNLAPSGPSSEVEDSADVAAKKNKLAGLKRLLDDKAETYAKHKATLDVMKVVLDDVNSKYKHFKVKSNTWNYRHSDKFDPKITQYEILLDCQNLSMKKSGASKLFSLGKNKPDETKQSNWIEVSVAFSKHSERDRRESAGRRVEERVKDAIKDSKSPPHSAGGSPAPASSSSPLPKPSDKMVWFNIAKTDYISHTENPVFPCGLLLECKEFSPDDKIKLDIYCKSNSSSTDQTHFGYVEFFYSELQSIAASESRRTFGVESLVDTEGSPCLNLRVVRPSKFSSNILDTYCLLGQSYNFLTDGGEVLNVRELCLEVPFAVQIPSLFLRLRESEIMEQIKRVDAEDKGLISKLRKILLLYQAQVSKVESDWNAIDYVLHGQKSFKPSKAKKAQNNISMPINLHAQIMQINTAATVDTRAIVTMGAPAVHFFRYKSGGIRKLRLKKVIAESQVPAEYRSMKKVKSAARMTGVSGGVGGGATLVTPTESKEVESDSDEGISDGEVVDVSASSTDKSLLNTPVTSPVSHRTTSSIKRQGWLEKKVPGLLYESTKKRYFVLNPSVGLEYHTVETTTGKPQGIIPLETIIDVAKCEGNTAFEVIASKRTYHLVSSTTEDALAWIKDFKEVLELHKKPVAPRVGIKSMPLGGSSKRINDTVSPVDGGAEGVSDALTPRSTSVSSNPSSPPNKSDKELRSGWMQKQQPRSNGWQRRFFRLYPASLQYFKGDSTDKAQNIIPLLDIIECKYIPEVKTVEIATKDRVYIIKPEGDEANSNLWIFHIKKAVAILKGDTTFNDTFVAATSILSQIHKGNIRSEVSEDDISVDNNVVDLRVRLDMAASQALAALVTTFVLKVEIALKHNPQELIRIAKLGFIFSLESLLSTSGSEEGMIEDMDAAIKEMRIVEFAFQKKSPESPVGDFSVTRDSVSLKIVVTIYLRDDIWAIMPKCCQDPSLRIFVVPLLFTQGINEVQSFVNKVGQNEIQQEINVENLSLLLEYFQTFIKYHRGSEWKKALEDEDMEVDDVVDYALFGPEITLKESKGDRRARKLEDLSAKMNLIESTIRNAKNTEKTYQILILTSDLIAELGGGRITCCKSGKDRTGMSCTLEQARYLRDRYSVGTPSSDDNKKYHFVIDMFRRHGVRLANARKNTGKSLFAFNVFQRQMLPDLYRPPASTCNKNVQS
jgi:hypothetical protein